MPRRKKLDITPVVEAFLAEIEFRVTRSMKDAVRDLERRLDRLEKRLAGKGGRAAPSRTYKVCRKPGCNGRVIAHRLCSRHYQQWRYHSKKAEQPPTKSGASGRKTAAKTAAKTSARTAARAGAKGTAAKRPARKRVTKAPSS